MITRIVRFGVAHVRRNAGPIMAGRISKVEVMIRRGLCFGRGVHGRENGGVDDEER